MSLPEIEGLPAPVIAKVRDTFLGWEDHGILTCVLHLEYGGGGGQGAGTYCLDKHGDDGREGTAFGLEWVMRAMEACGVREWKEVKGRTVIAYAEHVKVHAIAPLPTEPGRPFVFRELSDKYARELEAA